MAAPVAAAAAKLATGALQDKKFRNAAITVLLTGIFFLIAPVVLITSIAEGGADIDYRSPAIIEALKAGMSDEQTAKMKHLDGVMKKLQDAAEKEVPDADFIKIQIFYLCILYGQEKGSDTFYEDFVGCFKDAKNDKEIFENIEAAFGVRLTEKDKADVTGFYAKVTAHGGAMGDADFVKLMETAKAQLGKPYVFGAAGPDSFDCSGLTWYCFKYGLNKTIPRTAVDQQKACTPIKKRDRKPGDLIFFQNTYKPGVSHVGIYIGNDEMIHAPTTGDVVKYGKVTDAYYADHFHSYGRAE